MESESDGKVKKFIF